MVYSMSSGSTVYPKIKYYCTLDQKVEEAKIRMMIHVRVHVMRCWEGGHMTNFLKCSKAKFVALHCSFQNQLELCSKVLLLWRYEIKDFQKCCVFVFVFCIFLNENNTKSHDFTTFQKLKEGATIVVPWEIYQKRKLYTLKEKLALTDYKSL